MHRIRTAVLRSSTAVVAISAIACGDDVALGEGGSGVFTTGEATATEGSTSTSSTTEVDSGADETGGMSGGGGGFPCSMQGMFDVYEPHLPDTLVAEDFAEDVDPSVVCDFDEIVDGDGIDSDRLDTNASGGVDTFDVFVYRPADNLGDWPDAPPHPAIFFAPGRGLNLVNRGGDLTNSNNHLYWPFFESLTEAGFVVVAIEPSNNDWSGGKRKAALACAMLWARDETNGWAGAGAAHLADAAVIMGHSRGGSGANRLSKALGCLASQDPEGDGCCFAPDTCDAYDDLPASTTLDSYELCSTVAIAPRWNGGDETRVLDADAAPYLAVQGSIDDDVLGQGMPAYDANVSEDDVVANDPSTLRSTDKVAIWVYGPTHRAWGGTMSSLGVRGRDQALATGPYYVEQFLRWQLFRDMDARESVLAPMLPFPGQSDFPAGIWSSGLWTVDGTSSADPDLAVYYEGDGDELVGAGRPLVFGNYTQGTIAEGADRLVVDSLARGNDTDDCDGVFGDSTLGGALTFAPLAGGGGSTVCQGPASVTVGAAGLGSVHDTEALELAWGDGAPGLQADWSLLDAQADPLSTVRNFTHLSIRLANLADDCPTVPDEFTVEVELEFENGGQLEQRFVTTNVIVDEHGEDVLSADLINTICASSQFMPAIRIPLVEFCDQGMTAIDSITAVRVRFPNSDVRHHAMIDSTEFTRDPSAAGTETCPQARHDWNCEATNTLVATETSCAGEPTPTCSPGDVSTNPAPLPVVPAMGEQEAFDGWVVHSPRGWIVDAESPTGDELDAIISLCVVACELEWSDNPFVEPNCSDEGAFETPTVRATPGRGAVHRIPAAYEDGTDLFVGQSLDCNLESDCCESFDEGLCAASPRRTSAAQEPVGRGEEWLLTVAGAVGADSSFAESPVYASLEGVVGYSECVEGNVEGPCPFYLGSLELELAEPLTIVLDCGSPATHVLESLTISLVQPAFGMAEEDTDWKAFPPGALVFEGQGEVDGMPFHVVRSNEEPIYVYGSEGWIQLQGINGSFIQFNVPCGEELADLLAWVEFDAIDWPGEPPAIFIDVPSEVECPGTVPLEHTTWDEESDFASLRWLVDGVLLEDETTSVDFTTGHELTAIVRDERGATKTATKLITCE
ncbi:MAG: hypothetical protein K1X88_14380 [Nannocystaceae bacterium]|nr:hypothetical protein [Nannocystaceae bacterium]